MKESELFEPAKQFLLSRMNCENVFAEVVDLDVVGRCGSVYIGIEMKTSLNFKVIEQAEWRKHLVDYMFILVPEPKRAHARVVLDWLQQLGIGLMYFDEAEQLVKIHRWGKRQRSAKRFKIARYIDEQLDALNTGGVKGGESITPYKRTIDKIKYLLHRHSEGLTIEEILHYVQTHYSSPKPSVAATLKAAWNEEWCERERRGSQTVYRMKEVYRDTYWSEYRAHRKEYRTMIKQGVQKNGYS